MLISTIRFTDKVCSISTHFQILQSLRACHFCQMVNQKDIIGDLCCELHFFRPGPGVFPEIQFVHSNETFIKQFKNDANSVCSMTNTEFSNFIEHCYFLNQF